MKNDLNDNENKINNNKKRIKLEDINNCEKIKKENFNLLNKINKNEIKKEAIDEVLIKKEVEELTIKQEINENSIDLLNKESLEKKIKYPIKFLKGKTMPTYLAYEFEENNKPSIKFENLLDPNYISKAFMSSFVVDFDWLFSKLPSKEQNPDFNLCLVSDYDTAKEKAGRVVSDNGWLLVKPNLVTKGWGDKSWSEKMHAKLMLLVYPSFLRVVIGSANLVEYDWTRIQNTVYVQDLPLTTSMSYLTSIDPLSKICLLLNALNVPQSVSQLLYKYDWTYFNNADIILSIPGVYPYPYEIEYDKPASDFNTTIPLYGIFDLERLLYEKYSDTFEIQNSYYLTSSIGNLRPQFLDLFNNTVTNGIYNAKTFIIYPTEQYVNNSMLGPESAGTIFFNADYDKKNFPRELMREHTPKIKGSLSHSKIILRIDENKNGWYYCGSHNFTQAAWGNPYNEKIVINNFEIGVVVPITEDIYIPFELNPPCYKHTDKPWK